MTTILIANRGEVAARIARSVRDLGWSPVGVFAADDVDAPYLSAMDTAVALPASGPAAYLDVTALVRAAAEAGAWGLHPGWGFASENPALAEACAVAGLRFIGPSATLLRLFGDKVAARDAAIRAGVPVALAAGSLAQARALLDGGPVMLKASAGGGGRGMRIVSDADGLASSWDAAAAEALAAFGDASIFAERLIEQARHIEVQILGDGSDVVSLGTRDCSLQRRQQKLVETAPAVTAAPVEAAALRMAGGLGYCGLATWEFLVRGDAFWFLEVNPRLQVEHTVTEMVTGLDLVALQLRVSVGETLAALGLLSPPAPRGFAMQVRINAEQLMPDGDILPGGGIVTDLHFPNGPGIRVDHAIARGMTLNTRYDSLLAKLVIHAPDRATTLRRAARALAEVRIGGIGHSVENLQRLLALPELRDDTVHTQFLHAAAARIAANMSQAESAADAARITAPMPGTLVHIAVAIGDVVRRGQTVAVIEAMKMQMAVTAATSGTVLALAARTGDTLSAGQELALLRPDDHGDHSDAMVSAELDLIRPDLQAVLDRHHLTRDEGRPEAVAKRHAAGRRMIRENLAALFDPDSFSEFGALAIAAQRRRRSLDELIRVSPADGLIAGIGTVAAVPTAALAYDYTVMAGTQGFINHKKTDRLLHVVHQDRLPLVLFAEGGGGRPGDTDVMGVAGLDLSTFASFAALSGKAPLVGIAAGHCFAGNAAMLGCCDTIIATTDSSIGMGGPAMIEGGGLGVFRPEEVGPSSVQNANGVIDILAATEIEATETARRYLAYFDGFVPEFDAADQRLLRHAVPEDRKRIYDMRALIETLADTGSVLELRRGFGAGIITALVRVQGHAMGLIANNPAHLGGAIDAPAADKAARFIQLCDAHGLPILSLCDTPGFMVGPDTERSAQVRHVCRMFVTGAALSVPVFCVVTRKGYGLGAMAMAAGGFHQTRFTIAWPSGEFGGMGLEGAVRLGYRRELAAEADAESRQALFERLVARLYAEGEAINTASYLEIDAVIDPFSTRDWIARGLRAGVVRRGGRFIDSW